MIKFILNKIGRDKGLENFKSQGIIPKYRLLSGVELRMALKAKLLEESAEVQDAKTMQEVVEDLADVAELIDGLCKAYRVSLNDLLHVKEERRKTRGGFEKGLYVESIDGRRRSTGKTFSCISR